MVEGTTEKKDFEEKEKNKRRLLTIVILLIAMICLTTVSTSVIKQVSKIVNSEQFQVNYIQKGLVAKNVSFEKYEENQAYIKIITYDLISDKQLWCIATSDEKNELSRDDSDWMMVDNMECILPVDENDTYIYIRDDNNIGKQYKIADFVSKVLQLNIENTNVKIAVGEKHEIVSNIKLIGKPNTELEYISQNEKIAIVEDGKIIGKSDGKTKIVVSDKFNHNCEIEVQVTSLISLPKIDDSKTFLKYKQYTTEQAKVLDDYLFYRVKMAGDKTRAGVVAAARFLTLEFKYRVSYFLENGRLAHFNWNFPYADGEGRYYHKGLYLSTDKYKDIQKIVGGPGMWGTKIMEYSTENEMMPNGLDCSGFVTWCIYNGGFDLGDIGAGPSYGWITLAEYGESQKITMNLLKSGKVKAGDLIGFDGHIGIIIGIDSNNVYIADSYFYAKGVCATKFSFQELVNSSFTHIYDMSKTYKQDGNYTAMW